MTAPHRHSRTVLLSILLVVSVSASSTAGYTWLLERSTVFPDNVQEVNLCFGDVNNDGAIEMVVGKHYDHQTGRTVAFQQTAAGWDAGRQIYAGGNGNMGPVVGTINGNQWLVINRHDQNNYSGVLAFLRFDASFTLENSFYLSSLNHPYFSDQAMIGEDVYFTTRGALAKAAWNGAGFTVTELADDGEANKQTAVLADDVTGDGVQDLVYWTYDNGSRGLSVWTDAAEVEIDTGYTSLFATGQFDAETAVHEILYANNVDSSVTLVRYDAETGTFVSQVVLEQMPEAVYSMVGFDINGDGTDEALIGTYAGTIFEFNPVTGQLKTLVTSSVHWYDAVVADWGAGPRAVFAGSDHYDLSVVALGPDAALISDLAGTAYPQGTEIDIHWQCTLAAPVDFDVQVRAAANETWTTVATVPSQSGSCRVSGLLEGGYDLRLADASDNHVVYGQTDMFYVYTCTTALAGDLSGDCYVDLRDFGLIAAGYEDMNVLLTFIDEWLRCANPYDVTCSE